MKRNFPGMFPAESFLHFSVVHEHLPELDSGYVYRNQPPSNFSKYFAVSNNGEINFLIFAAIKITLYVI